MPRPAPHPAPPTHVPTHGRHSAEPQRPNGATDAGTKAGSSDATGAASAYESSAGLPGWAGQLRLPLSYGLQTLMLMLHAGEEWQRAQLDCWHLALKRHEQAHQRVLDSQDTAEMVSVHADLLRFDTANLTQLSQRCMDNSVQLGTDIARLLAQMLDGGRHHAMRSGFEALQSSLHTGIRPLDEMFNSSLLRELGFGAMPRKD